MITLLISLNITDIRVSGNRFFKSDFIKSLFGYKRRFIFFKKYPKFSPFAIRRGIDVLEEIYKDSGFFDVKVHWEKSVEKKGVVIFLNIYEGKRYVINDIDVPEDLRVKLSLPKPYTIAYVSNIEEKILSYYRNNGYPFVEVNREEYKDHENKTVKIVFSVSKGDRIIIRNVMWKSSDTTKPLNTRWKIFKREIKVKGGEFFKERDVEESVSRLYRTQLFNAIFWKLENVKDGYADLVFYVKEGPPRVLDLSFGFQSETKHPILIKLENIFQHLNLFNNLQRLQLLSYVLVDVANTNLNAYNIRVLYQEPYFLDFNLRANFNIPVFYDRDRNLFQYGLAGEITKPYFWGENNSLNFGLSYDKRRALSEEQNYDIFRIYQSVFFDTRDNIFDPNFGSVIRFEIYEAGLGYLGNYDYIKWVSDISLYQRFFLSEWKWALRLYFGGIFSYMRSDTLPIIDLFTVGGEGQVRGYDRFSIGPDLKECYSYICKAGRYPLVFNYEIRRKINDYWGFVLFFDYGYLDGDKGYSGGMGIRYFTPIGPIRFDWAIKLKDRSPTDRGKIYISLGHMF